MKWLHMSPINVVGWMLFVTPLMYAAHRYYTYSLWEVSALNQWKMFPVENVLLGVCVLVGYFLIKYTPKIKKTL